MIEIEIKLCERFRNFTPNWIHLLVKPIDFAIYSNRGGKV